MKNLKFAVCILLPLFAFFGCEKTFLGADPENSPEQNFQIFWNDYDRYYAQFALWNIDWDSVYAVNRPHISSSTTEQQLFTAISHIVLGINDMHVSVHTGSRDVFWKSSGTGDGISLTDERFLIIDDILSKWKDMKGMIIDLRGNQGGNGINAEVVAGRFTDKARVYTQYREKTGQGKLEFSPWKNSSIEPKGAYQFLKPVVVLTSRATASAAEMFVMAMHALPHVTIVGDTTGGGVGAPVYRELPNGWTYRISTRYYADAQQRIVEREHARFSILCIQNCVIR